MKVDLTGKRQGKLVAVKYLGASTWLCKCDCGGQRKVKTGHFNAGYFKCCKCTTKHGLTGGREHASWGNMIARCHNPNNKRYKDYAGKGIFVCDRWREAFINFYNDMGKCPDGYQIDRIDNNKGYYPANCRWVSPKENMANRKNSRIYVVFGKEYRSAKQAADEYGVCPQTISHWCWLRKRKDGTVYNGRKGCYAKMVYGD